MLRAAAWRLGITDRGRVRRRRVLRRAARPPGAGRLRDAAEAGVIDGGAVPVTRSPRARLRLPGADPRGTRALRCHRSLPRRPGDRATIRRRAADPDAGRDRRVRAGEDRRALPPREALPRPRRRGIFWKVPTAIGASPAPRTAQRDWRSTSPRPRSCAGSSTPTSSAAGRSAQIAADLSTAAIPSPTGKPVWGTSTLGGLLRNEAYIGTVYYNRHETDAPGHARGQVHPPARPPARGMDHDPGPSDHRL